MKRKSFLGALMLGGSLFVFLPQPAMARGRGGGGAVFVGGGFGGGYGWYDPWWGYPYPGAYGVDNTGTVKFDTDVKDAAVYVDGGYAGTVGKVKSLRLRPGTYTIELRHPGHTPYTEKVYVAAGKTVKVNPDQPNHP
jgi:hypothetical protein